MRCASRCPSSEGIWAWTFPHCTKTEYSLQRVSAQGLPGKVFYQPPTNEQLMLESTNLQRITKWRFLILPLLFYSVELFLPLRTFSHWSRHIGYPTSQGLFPVLHPPNPPLLWPFLWRSVSYQHYSIASLLIVDIYICFGHVTSCFLPLHHNLLWFHEVGDTST